MIKHRIWLTAETARSFLPVLGDDNGDFDPVGERLERTSDYNRNAIYVIYFRSKNFFLTHPPNTNFKPFCVIKTYLKYLLWKKKPESLTQNHVIHVCMYCIFKRRSVLVNQASYISCGCEAFTWFECPVGLFEYSITFGTQTMSCRGGFLWERARDIEPVSNMVNSLKM